MTPPRRKIKVTAFGRSNTYDHVQSISGDFGDGNDSVVIKNGVLVPVTIHGGSGDDVLNYDGLNRSDRHRRRLRGHQLHGEAGDDFLSATGHANVLLDGGSETTSSSTRATAPPRCAATTATTCSSAPRRTTSSSARTATTTCQGVAKTFRGGSGNDVLRSSSTAPTTRGHHERRREHRHALPHPGPTQDTLDTPAGCGRRAPAPPQRRCPHATGSREHLPRRCGGADIFVVADLGTDSGRQLAASTPAGRSPSAGTRTEKLTLDMTAPPSTARSPTRSSAPTWPATRSPSTGRRRTTRSLLTYLDRTAVAGHRHQGGAHQHRGATTSMSARRCGARATPS